MTTKIIRRATFLIVISDKCQECLHNFEVHGGAFIRVVLRANTLSNEDVVNRPCKRDCDLITMHHVYELLFSVDSSAYNH